MARATRRQTPQQRLATIFGGVIVLALIVVLLSSVIQGSKRPATDSIMQRVLSARVAPYHFISDTARVEGDTVYVIGHYSGTPKELPSSDTGWQDLATNVAKVYASDLSGVAKSVSIEYHHQGQLKAHATESVK